MGYFWLLLHVFGQFIEYSNVKYCIEILCAECGLWTIGIPHIYWHIYSTSDQGKEIIKQNIQAGREAVCVCAQGGLEILEI